MNKKQMNENEVIEVRHSINQMVRKLSAFFAFDLLLAAVIAAVYLNESPSQVFQEFFTILTSPSPLVTDYFYLGSLPAALLNAGLCGLCCSLLIQLQGTKYRPNIWAGYFLVIAHAFYGLNLLNIWPLIIAFTVYCRMHQLRLRDNLDKAMFITSFSPFISEILFRYPVLRVTWTIGAVSFNPVSVCICFLLSFFVAFTLPAMLPGTSKLHRGYNLYNGGLATGLLGLFLYGLLFKTMGIVSNGPLVLSNLTYALHRQSYPIFGNVFFGLIALASILYGWFLNGRSFRGYTNLLQDSGYKANFFHDYGIALTWMNLGFYLLMILAYFDIVIALTKGAGFTGPTFGIILAAMTFAASGQHPHNVWPILLGYVTLSLMVHGICMISGRDIPWTLSTQAYMNGVAFATGLCPFAGKFGWKIGVLAGMFSAVMCTTTSAMHGGFVLYNGGLTAGITALILVPILDTYVIHSEEWGQDDRSKDPRGRK